MTRKECKKYLEEYRYLKIEVKSMEELKSKELDFFGKAYKVLEEKYFPTEAVSYFNSLDNGIKNIQKKIVEIEKTINSVENKELKEILWLKFIENKTIEEITDIIFRSYTNISKMTSQGLDECLKLLENDI